MNRKERRASEKQLRSKSGTSTESAWEKGRVVEQVFGGAIEHHRAGRWEEAEKAYRSILSRTPHHFGSLLNLGVLSSVRGEKAQAIELLNAALKEMPGSADVHGNLGAVYLSVGEVDRAIASSRRAIELNPTYAEAHANLAAALETRHQIGAAAESAKRALAIKPNLPQAHFTLGNVCKAEGKFDAALERFERAISLSPRYFEAHSNAGAVYQALGKPEMAVECYRRALALSPDSAAIHINLATAFRALEDTHQALAHCRAALALTPGNAGVLAEFSRCLRGLHVTSFDEAFKRDLLMALSARGIRRRDVVPAATSVLKLDPAILELIRAVSVRGALVLTPKQCAALADNDLLLKVLESEILADVEVEHVLTALRRSVLFSALEASGDDASESFERLLPLLSALAIQCFLNEYIFAETPEETAGILRILGRGEIEKLSPVTLAILAAYRPLHAVSSIETTLATSPTSPLAKVIEHQLREPLAERTLRGEIRCISPIDGRVSLAVRSQYEESPYPRWIEPNIATVPRPFWRVMRGIFPSFLPPSPWPGDPIEILIAGCGTGQQPIEVAAKYQGAKVLALDLSLTSLSYALRETRERGLTNLEYAQADLLNLDALDRQFDVIECAGVLHHLEDPIAGWRVLDRRLRSGGFMKIGLYSELARQEIVKARAMIAERGLAANPETIRDFRQEVFADNARLGLSHTIQSRDFFSMSACRDLLFHVQEHRFDLETISRVLGDLGHVFVGFELSEGNIDRRYRARFPKDLAMNSLSNWSEFERENPRSFAGMYQFWTYKP